MRALVLGGGGFIGRHLCQRLSAAGHDVLVFDRVATPDWPSMVGDFRDRGALSTAVRGVDWVFHLIWTTLPRSSNANPSYDVESNVIATLGLLDVCVAANVRKVIFASSGGTVYGAAPTDRFGEDHPHLPICSYGITKLIVEKYLHLYHHLHGLEYVGLRVSNPYGEGQNPWGEQGAIAVFLGRLLRGQAITIFGDGGTVRDYIYIGDVADAFVKAALAGPGKERIYNIGSGIGVSLRNLLEVMRQVTGLVPQVHQLPARTMDVPRVVLDIERATRCLGWRPATPLRAGIERTWSWIQQLPSTAFRNVA
jgi:UDP-glucose 4-epimerase